MDMNTMLRTEAKNDYDFKLTSNAVFLVKL